jgi:hypothetical protein
MTWPQYAHPEFGYFCPTPRLRRELRIAFVSILFGAIGGAAAVVALVASHRNADPATVASVVTANTAKAVPPSNGEATPTGAPSHNGLQAGPKTNPVLTAINEVAKGDTAPAAEQTNAAKTACEDDASSMSGPCLADKPRRVRATATGGPDVARLPLGRTAAPSDAVLANPADGMAEKLQSSAQDNAAAATPPSSENQQDPAHASGAPAKKTQTIARSQNRQRNEQGADSRTDRADPWVGRVDTNNRSGRPGHVNAREGSYARQGFWDWSR